MGENHEHAQSLDPNVTNEGVSESHTLLVEHGKF